MTERKKPKIQRIEAGTKLERIVGAKPYVLAVDYWYGRPATVYQRVSDLRIFTVYPRGAAKDWLDRLEERAMEKLSD